MTFNMNYSSQNTDNGVCTEKADNESEMTIDEAIDYVSNEVCICLFS